MLVSQIGQVGFPTAEDKRLTGVQVRPDGLVRLDRETGWTVIDPSKGRGRGVARRSGQRHPGQFL